MEHTPAAPDDEEASDELEDEERLDEETIERLASGIVDDSMSGDQLDDLDEFKKRVKRQAQAAVEPLDVSETDVELIATRAGQIAYHRWMARQYGGRRDIPFISDSAQVAAVKTTESRKKGMEERGSRRVNVNFSDQAYDTLERLARQTGKSMSDVLRDAIALKAWFEQTRAEGGHVLVERRDGQIREIISV